MCTTYTIRWPAPVRPVRLLARSCFAGSGSAGSWPVPIPGRFLPGSGSDSDASCHLLPKLPTEIPQGALLPKAPGIFVEVAAPWPDSFPKLDIPALTILDVTVFPILDDLVFRASDNHVFSIPDKRIFPILDNPVSPILDNHDFPILGDDDFPIMDNPDAVVAVVPGTWGRQGEREAPLHSKLRGSASSSSSMASQQLLQYQ